MSDSTKIKLGNTMDRISGSILSGNELNPPSRLSNPCSICNKNCLNNQACIECSNCAKWCHIKCDGTTLDDYHFYQDTQDDQDIKWYCLYCTMIFNHINIPFTLCSDSNLTNINNSDNMEFTNVLPSLETIHETSSYSKYSLPDDDFYPKHLTSKYHSVYDFQNLKIVNDFSIFHSNVNGLESKFDNMNNFLVGCSSTIDIIAITETSEQVNESFLSNVDLEGYSLSSTPTLSGKGGTALYVNNKYNSFERVDLRTQDIDFESTWVEIKNSNSKNIICGCIYRHPRQDVTKFLDHLDSTLCKLSKENKELYLCGDFNIDLLKIDSVNHNLQFFNLLNSNGLLPLILHPSRVVEGQVPSLIDNIFSNNINNKIISGNIYLNLSEHFCQFSAIKREKIDTKKIDMFGRDYSKFTEQNFRDDVSIQRWNHASTDTNLLMSDFVWRLNGCVDRHAPVKKLSPKDIKLTLNPWITPDIQKLIRIRDKLFARKKRQPDNTRVRELYNQVRNRVSRETQKSKGEYYKAYFNTHTSNIKKTWEGIRKLVNVKSNTNFSISQLNVNGSIIDDPTAITNSFNDFFVNVGPVTEKTVPKVPNMSPEKFLKDRNQTDFILAHISENEILDIIQALPNKGTGPASIPLKLLKLVVDLIILPLCRIINLSFSSGTFPEILKTQKIIPLHKGGSTQELNNFRPISLLSIFDKIIEKIMHKRLYTFLEIHNIIYENQFGFKKKHSTGHSLMEITEKIKESIDNGNYGCGIFIDLKKAFDTVNHKILLMKLEHYGVRGSSLKWFESYLTDRKQFVFYNGVSSDTKTITCGVPQGSVLGPLLFLLYINDLPNISDKLRFFLFADDTNIYYESKNLIELENTVNSELKKLCLWLNLNRLALNVGKTNFVIFRANKPLYHNVTLIMNRKALLQKDHIKYLGVLMDEHLTWKNQITSVSKKISRGIGILSKLKNFMGVELLKTIYYCLVYSHLSYGIEAWGSASADDLHKILVLQKKAVRIMSGSQYFQIYGEPAVPLPASEPLFKNLRILKLSDVFILNISKFIFLTLLGQSPAIFTSWFTLSNSIHTHATTSSTIINRDHHFDTGTVTSTKTLFTKGSKLAKYGARMIRVSGPVIWNRLPTEIQDSPSLPTFKIRLKKHLLSIYTDN